MTEHCQDVLRGAVSQIKMVEHCRDVLRGAVSQIKMVEHCRDVLRGAVSQIEMTEHSEPFAANVTNLFSSSYINQQGEAFTFFVFRKFGFGHR
jgi:hypothetical protein